MLTPQPAPAAILWSNASKAGNKLKLMWEWRYCEVGQRAGSPKRGGLGVWGGEAVGGAGRRVSTTASFHLSLWHPDEEAGRGMQIQI